MIEDNPSLSVAIDRDEVNRLLRSLLAACPPETIDQVGRLFIDGGDPYQASALFDHAFVISPAGLRLRSVDEFVLVINDLYSTLGKAP